MRARILIAMVLKRPIGRKGRTARQQKHPGKRGLREALKKPAKLIEVVDEAGRVVYRGANRRTHREQVFFDSTNSTRRFIGARKISRKRLRELKKLGEVKVFFEKPAYPSQRSSKRKLKTI